MMTGYDLDILWPAVFRSVTLDSRESQIRTMITLDFWQSTSPLGGTEHRKSCSTQRATVKLVSLLSLCLSVCVSLFVCLCVSVCLFVCLCLSIFLLLTFSAHFLFLSVSLYSSLFGLFIILSVFLTVSFFTLSHSPFTSIELATLRV